MNLNNMLDFKINSKRALFKVLMPSDVTGEYINSLQFDDGYLENADDVSLSSQVNYVAQICDSRDRLLCGIFVNNELLGTSGIQLYGRGANCGILIFKNSRGQGLGKILVWCAAKYAIEFCGVNVIKAGVHIDNLASKKSFTACGFTCKVYNNEYEMTVTPKDLYQPKTITNVRIVNV